MATNADGSVVIDTKIDQSGFNSGLKKIAASAASALNGVLFQTVRIGEAAKSVISKVLGTVGKIASGIGNILKKALLGAFIVFALSIQKIFDSLREAFTNILNLKENAALKRDVEEIQSSFTELRAAIINAFLPLITAAVPYIKMALSWLIELFNKAAQITAAFMGQKQALQIIQGSAQKIADANKKTEKAAKGQLAAFDQINVLQKQDTGTDVKDLPKVAAEMVPVTDDILSKVTDIKNEIAEWFADPIGKLKKTWGAIAEWFRSNILAPLAQWWQDTWFGEMITGLWENFIATWQKIIENSIESFHTVRENIIQFFTGIMEFVHGVFTGDWELAWKGLSDIVSAAFSNLWTIIRGTWTNILTLLGGWGNALRIIIQPVLDWLGERFEGLRERISGIWENIKDGFQSAFTGMQDFAKGVINSIIDFFNRLIEGVTNGINSMVTGANAIGGIVPGFQPLTYVTALQVPHLATGAVIPPNAEFLAVMGDQRSGRNLETPEGLMRQIIREELGNSNSEINVPITLTLDGEVLYRSNQRVSTRHGKSLISGGNT